MSASPRCAILALLVFGSAQIGAQVNDFGVGGILDIPTSRMAEEGTLTTTYSRKDVADIYAIGYQPLPRLEASFRYTIFNARKKSPVPGTSCDFGSSEALDCDDNRDRSFEVKYRLMDESQYLPEISVGVRDLLGTGVWAGEYVSASKRFGNLDASLSMGWGRFAERAIAENPLTTLNDGFGVRPTDFGQGGTISSDSVFRGKNVGLFGGVRYSIPERRLALVAAYNSDSYARERDLNTIPNADPLSLGIEWEASPGVTLALSRQQGNQWAFRLSANLDTAVETPRKRPEGFGSDASQPAPARDEPGWDWWYRMAADAEDSGLLIRESSQRDGVLHVAYANRSYQLEADAVRRSLELIDLYAPLDVERIVLTGEALGLSTHTVSYRRPDPRLPPVLRPNLPVMEDEPREVASPDRKRNFRYPNGEINLGLNARAYLFDPDFPLLYQIALKVRGDADLGNGWGASGTWSQSLKSQFDRIAREGSSLLPPVRTDLKEYLQQGENGIDELYLVKRGKLGSAVFYQAYAGILEEMYSGVGAEVLWRPDSPLAFGVSINGVVQREFDKLFGVRDFKTITGHASVYWATPFHNFDVSIHAGRYLAGDIGATVEVQKRFANGWSVGAFATLTDVPFAVFGEGSFDKGLIFNIPFDLYSPRNTRGSYRTILRSINRDGGRMLDNWPGGLWEGLRRTHGDRLRQGLPRMLPGE
jgi:hypothetical protein